MTPILCGCSFRAHGLPACAVQPAGMAGSGAALGVCLWYLSHPGGLAHLCLWLCLLLSRLREQLHPGTPQPSHQTDPALISPAPCQLCLPSVLSHSYLPVLQVYSLSTHCGVHMAHFLEHAFTGAC